jgi:regulator of protease activity HflC (stomatin/prohibitin superfamily)
MKSELVGPEVYLKLPLLHQVDVYDRRIKRFESAKRELPMDQEPIEIGYFVVWRIGDVRVMRENLLPSQILPLIDDKTYSAVRNELARHKVVDLLSPERAEIVEHIRDASRGELARVGIEVLGIGLSDIEYPEKNLENVFAGGRDLCPGVRSGARVLRLRAQPRGVPQVARRSDDARALARGSLPQVLLRIRGAEARHSLIERKRHAPSARAMPIVPQTGIAAGTYGASGSIRTTLQATQNPATASSTFRSARASVSSRPPSRIAAGIDSSTSAMAANGSARRA